MKMSQTAFARQGSRRKNLGHSGRGTEEGQQERVFSLSTQWSVVGTALRRVVPLAPSEG